MRIYCNQSTDTNELTQFIGQDAWVTCINIPTETVVYVKIYGQPNAGSGIFRGNVISQGAARRINNPDNCTDWQRRQAITCIINVNMNDFRVLHPLQVYTTAELFPSYTTYSKDLARFIGKDLWVKVFDLSSRGFNDTYYICIKRRVGDIIEFCNIKSSLLDYDADEGYFDSDEFSYWTNGLDFVDFDHIDNYQLWDPPEVLTTEELMEILATQQERLERFEAENEYYE